MIKINKYNHKILSETVTETDFNNETIIIRPWVMLIGCTFNNCLFMVPDYITDIHFGEYTSCKFKNTFILRSNTKSLMELSES